MLVAGIRGRMSELLFDCRFARSRQLIAVRLHAGAASGQIIDDSAAEPFGIWPASLPNGSVRPLPAIPAATSRGAIFEMHAFAAAGTVVSVEAYV